MSQEEQDGKRLAEYLGKSVDNKSGKMWYMLPYPEWGFNAVE